MSEPIDGTNRRKYTEAWTPENQAWSRNLMASLSVGGVWAVPRSGLLFQKTNEDPPRMELIQVMPWSDEMPMSADELLRYQQDDYDAIAKVFGATGITVTVKEGTW